MSEVPLTPRTPKRRRNNTHAKRNSISNSNSLLSPSETPKSSSSSYKSNVFKPKSPIKYHLKTPEYTPKKSINRKLVFSDNTNNTINNLSIFNHDTVNNNNSNKFGGCILFPPAHSTIGSGRSNHHATKSLFDGFKPSQDESENFDINTDDDEMNIELEEEELEVSTPGDKIISFEMAEKWNNHSKNHFFKYINESQELNELKKDLNVANKKDVENPFISSSKPVGKQLTLNDIDFFENQIELIDKNGVKKYRKLTNYEKSINPRRKLFQDDINDFKTPINISINDNNKLSEPELSKNDIIRHDKSINPFITTSNSNIIKSSIPHQVTFVDSNGKQVDKLNNKIDIATIKPKKLNFD